LSKGVIFTIDALLALSIFIAAAIGFYSFFPKATTFSTSGINSYSFVDNSFYAYDSSESISLAVREYQKGNVSGAEEMLNSLINYVGYPVNADIYLLNESGLSKILEVKTQNFEEYFVIRKYLVLTVTENLPKESGNASVSAPSSLANKTIGVNVTIHNPKSSPIDVNVSMEVYNSTDDKMPWQISQFQTTTINASKTSTLIFNVTIPPNAIIGEYYAKAIVKGGLNENATEPFNVIRYGLLTVEAESR